MIAQKIAHCTGPILTQEMARIGLEGYGVIVAWHTSQNNRQFVVRLHPYHKIVLPIFGSNVLYAFRGSLYTLHPGEVVLLPAEIYHSGRYMAIDIVSSRPVVQISARIWDYTIHASGLIDPNQQKNIVILSADAVSTLDLRGHLERTAQIPWIKKAYQETVLNCELMELQLFINQLVEEQYTKSPSLTSVLVSRVVGYVQKYYTEPSLTVASLAENIFTGQEHLFRTFKEYTMENIHGYINNLRMQHSRRNIAVEHSVLDVCTSSGFASYNSFLKSFRNLYEMTPTQHHTQPSSIEKGNLNTYDPQVRTNSFGPFGGSLQL